MIFFTDPPRQDFILGANDSMVFRLQPDEQIVTFDFTPIDDDFLEGIETVVLDIVAVESIPGLSLNPISTTVRIFDNEGTYC